MSHPVNHALGKPATAAADIALCEVRGADEGLVT
jgi:hypothetical protein